MIPDKSEAEAIDICGFTKSSTTLNVIELLHVLLCAKSIARACNVYGIVSFSIFSAE